MKIIPKATEHQSKVGWTIEFSFLEKLTNKTNLISEKGINIEHTEDIILQLIKLGYLSLQK